MDEVALANVLSKADNKYLAEQRKFVREAMAALKSIDRDLKSLTQMNDNAKNAVMGFNDARLDEQQRGHTSLEAAKEFTVVLDTVRQMMPLSGE